MKIQSGNWEDGTLTLSDMPKHFILSARAVVVLEVDEYYNLRGNHLNKRPVKRSK